jgi:hypothetical protein
MESVFRVYAHEYVDSMGPVKCQCLHRRTLSEFAQMKVNGHETRNGLNSRSGRGTEGACDPQCSPLLHLVHKKHKRLVLSSFKKP